MINLAVISIKDIFNFFKKIIIVIIIICLLFKIIGILKNGNYVTSEELKNKSFLDYSSIINETIVISKYYKSESLRTESGIKQILGSELAILGTEEELMEKENQEEVIEFENSVEVFEDVKDIEGLGKQVIDEVASKEEKKEDIPNSLPTKVIEKNNKTDRYTDIYKTVKIKNESNYKLSEDIVTPNYMPTNIKDIIIYHTHTCESYTPTEKDNYQASGNFRTTDLNYSVARVGTEFEKCLIFNGFNVKHDKTYHDYPAYTGSYTRSLATIKNIIEENYSGIVIDLHRDALGSNSSYAPSVQIGDEVAAQLMFVIGTDGGGLEHPHWKKNLKLAIKIQEKANEMYSGLFKPIILRNSRYNQHVSDGAFIIEVGATGNTLEQCNISMKYLAEVLKEIMSPN